MFTGIIQAIGRIGSLDSRGGDVRLTVAVGALDMGDVSLGDGWPRVLHFPQAEDMAALLDETLAGRDLPETVLLLGPGAEYLTGQTIAIDGGSYLSSGGNFSQLLAWGDEEWNAAKAAIQGQNQKDRSKRTV